MKTDIIKSAAGIIKNAAVKILRYIKNVFLKLTVIIKNAKLKISRHPKYEVLKRSLLIVFSLLFILIVSSSSVLLRAEDASAESAFEEAGPVPTPVETSALVETSAPAETPTPAPTEKPTPEAGGDFYDSFFDGAVFIGDSVTQGLQNYVTRARVRDPQLLGSAKFAAAKSFSLSKAASNKTAGACPTYRGKKYSIPNIINVMGAKKVFIMLGMNDGAGYYLDRDIEHYSKLIDNIRSVNPGVKIYIESCTPVGKKKQKKKLNNKLLDKFNEALKELCVEKGVSYVDIATVLKDENNALRPSYSSDKYVHMSAEGAKVWVDALYRFAYDEYVAGNWEPLS